MAWKPIKIYVLIRNTHVGKIKIAQLMVWPTSRIIAAKPKPRKAIQRGARAVKSVTVDVET
jgi:hypothetical protein